MLIGVPRALITKSHEVRRRRLRNLAIYFMAVVLVFALIGANNRIARTRAERLVVAVKAYEDKASSVSTILERAGTGIR